MIITQKFDIYCEEFLTFKMSISNWPFLKTGVRIRVVCYYFFDLLYVIPLQIERSFDQNRILTLFLNFFACKFPSIIPFLGIFITLCQNQDFCPKSRKKKWIFALKLKNEELWIKGFLDKSFIFSTVCHAFWSSHHSLNFQLLAIDCLLRKVLFYKSLLHNPSSHLLVQQQLEKFWAAKY